MSKIILKATSSLLLCAIASTTSFAQEAGNPFMKPQLRNLNSGDSCDMIKIQELVEQKLIELSPSAQDLNVNMSNHPLTNRDKILSSGAKLFNTINGTDVYFNDETGLFIYDKPDNKNQGLQ